MNPGELDQDLLVVADNLDELVAGGRVLLDPNTLSADGTVALNAVEVSPDGTLVAVALAEAGSDWRNIRVFDVATGAPLPDRADLDQVGVPDLVAGQFRLPVLAVPGARRRRSSPTRWAPASWCCTGWAPAGRRPAGLGAAGRPRVDGRSRRSRPTAGG